MAHPVRLTYVVMAFVFVVSIADAEIIEFRKVGNKTIECMHTGLMSDLKDCGFRSDWYAYVFVGSISAITPSENDESIIQIMPEEIFSGAPTTPLSVITSQGLCLPTFAVGDHWLFYLRKENGKPIVLDYYGNDSRPASEAEKEIETLRQLKTNGALGIVRGSVERGGFGDRKAVANAQVTAAKSDGARSFTATDPDGNFQFEPLSPGTYKLTVDPIGSFRPDEDSVDVKPGSCWDITMSKSPHAQISGHLRYPDGSPAAGVPVLIIDADGLGYNTLQSDAQGDFSSESMSAGKYRVAVRPPGAPSWQISSCGGAACEIPPGALYYPWLHDRSDALVIDLAEDEKRKNIDFTIPKK